METKIEAKERVEYDDTVNAMHNRRQAERRIEIDPDSGLITCWKGGTGHHFSVTEVVETMHEHGDDS